MGYFMFIGGDKSVACVIERDHPIISRKSCVIDVLLWEALRQGKEEGCGGSSSHTRRAWT